MRRKTSQPKSLPDLAYLKEHFHYDETSGVLTRVKSSRGLGKVGEAAGCTTTAGRRVVGIRRHLYQASRVIWYMVTGVDPKGQLVDHVNGDPSDNRFENLRLADYSQNGQNRKISCNNSTGHKNISRKKRDGKYRVQTKNRDAVVVIDFTSLEDAVHYADIIRKQQHQNFARKH